MTREITHLKAFMLGLEGLADIHIIRALYQSVQTGQPVRLPTFDPGRRPTPDQQIKRPAVKKPNMVNASSPLGSS